MTAHRDGSVRGVHHDHRTMHEAVWTAARARAFLDDPARLDREDPRALWKRAGLAAGMRVAEVGAGSGFYAFPASDLVGPSGRVYAIDVSPALVKMVRDRARRERRSNVETVRSTPARIPLADSIADRVLLANVLHGIPPSTVGEAVRLLRPGGHLVDLDWKKSATAHGPPVDHRLSAASARRALERYGLRTVREGAFGPYHYLLVLTKPAAAPTPLRRPRSG